MNMNLVLAGYILLLAVLVGCFLRFARRRIRVTTPAVATAALDFTSLFTHELQALPPVPEILLLETPTLARQAAQLPLLRRADLDLLAKVNAFARVANAAAHEPL